MKVKVIGGNVVDLSADALITAINSGGMWFGGIDGVIMRAAGNEFHNQARNAAPLSHGQAVVAKGSGQHSANFRNVVFVVDDLQGPLHEIVYAGLKAAADAGFKSVSLPTIRMGVMLGAVEKSVDEAVQEMADGISKFRAESPEGLESITFVVFGDASTQTMLTERLAA